MRVPAIPAWTALIVLAIALPLQADSASSDGWEHVAEDGGITTWKREVPGQEVPDFRGQVVIDADIDAVRNAIEDWQHHTQWMHRCAESKQLKRLNEIESLLYNRTDSPWPVSDRDVVVKTKRQVSSDGSDILLSFQNVQTELQPAVDGVVRMPRLAGFYKLTRLRPGKTKVVYQVEANVGGSLPKWIVKRVVKDMPYETLARLRERVAPD